VPPSVPSSPTGSNRQRTQGARVLCGGTYDGNYFQPTVIADVTPSMSVFQEELFGPVVSVIKAKDADDAIKLANNTRYGLYIGG